MCYLEQDEDEILKNHSRLEEKSVEHNFKWETFAHSLTLLRPSEKRIQDTHRILLRMIDWWRSIYRESIPKIYNHFYKLFNSFS